MNRPTNAGVNADAPASPKANRGALRREAPTGIEPVNSGFAGQYDAPAIDRDGPATQENDDSGTAMPSRVGGMDGARMPAGMPGVAGDLRALEPPTSTESYDAIATAFLDETGMMAPGKDVPAGFGGPSYEERARCWGVWLSRRSLAALTREAQARGEYDAWDALPPVMQRALELFGAEAYEAGQADALAGRDVEAPNIPDDADFAVGFGPRGRALIARLAAPVRDAAGTGTDGERIARRRCVAAMKVIARLYHDDNGNLARAYPEGMDEIGEILVGLRDDEISAECARIIAARAGARP